MSETLTVPVHLGLILDGNRRWATTQNLPTLEGHRKGYENLKTIGKEAIKRGVKYVSAYVFSTENWQRSQEEVDYLMKLLTWVAKTEVNDLHKEGIRVRFLGREEKLSKTVITAIRRAEEKTKDNVKGTLLLCLNYGGQQEIVDAVNRSLHKNPHEKSVTLSQIEQNLYAADVPAVDLIIRTSGEQRLSNFMLWRAAYSELIFIKKHWPDFSASDLGLCLDEYAARQRRFGA